MRLGVTLVIAAAALLAAPTAGALTRGESAGAPFGSIRIRAASPGHVTLAVVKVRYTGARAAAAPTHPRFVLRSAGNGTLLTAVHVWRAQKSTSYTFMLLELTPARTLLAAQRNGAWWVGFDFGPDPDAKVVTVEPGVEHRAFEVRDLDRSHLDHVGFMVNSLLDSEPLDEWNPIHDPPDRKARVDVAQFDASHLAGWKQRREPLENVEWVGDVLQLLSTPRAQPVHSLVDDLFKQAGLAPAGGTYTCDANALSGVVFRSAPESFDPRNGYANGGSAPTFSTDGKAYCLESLSTTHYNDGKGTAPGTIGLRGADGTILGPWPAHVLRDGFTWRASPPAGTSVILNGTYTVVDSGPSTWTSSAASGGRGFTVVTATLAKKSG